LRFWWSQFVLKRLQHRHFDSFDFSVRQGACLIVFPDFIEVNFKAIFLLETFVLGHIQWIVDVCKEHLNRVSVDLLFFNILSA